MPCHEVVEIKKKLPRRRIFSAQLYKNSFYTHAKTAGVTGKINCLGQRVKF
jgi:hypothetical protein